MNRFDLVCLGVAVAPPNRVTPAAPSAPQPTSAVQGTVDATEKVDGAIAIYDSEGVENYESVR